MVSTRSLALLLLLAATAVGGEADWHLAEAPERFALRPAGKTPPAATVGAVYLFTAHRHFAVLTESGERVGHQVLWHAPDEAVKLLFDCRTQAAAYWAYASDTPLPTAPAWMPAAGLRLETRSLAQHDPIDTLDQVKALWAAGAVLGRSLVPQIFDGIHPHGPSQDFIARYRGWFVAPRPGTYTFATVSDDGSWLLVNGQPVASWPGYHGPHAGRRGSHSGTITLGAGTHAIEYWGVQGASIFTFVAAWQRPGEKHPSVMPADAFVPVPRWRSTACEVRGKSQGRAAFSWRAVAHTRDAGSTLVTVECAALRPPPTGHCVWDFDDGVTARGATVRHILTPGRHTIALAIRRGGKTIATRVQPAHIAPVWRQREAWPEAVARAQAERIAVLDADALPATVLAALARWARVAGEAALFSNLGAACLKRQQALEGEDRRLFYHLGFHYQEPHIRRYAAGVRAFRAFLAGASGTAEERQRCKLHLAGLFIHGLGRPQAGQALLTEELDPAPLSDADRRLARLYSGDAHLAQGAVDAARAAYLSAGSVVEHTDLHYVSRRRARLESAKDYLRRGAYDEAIQLAREVEWETPLERLGTETGLIMIAGQAGRGETVLARNQCLRLLHCAPMGRDRAEILYWLAALDTRLGRTEEAAATRRRLYEEHPYSEAAARALERWGR